MGLIKNQRESTITKERRLMENVLGEMELKDLIYRMSAVYLSIIESTEHIPHNVNERYGLSMILLLMM